MDNLIYTPSAYLANLSLIKVVGFRLGDEKTCLRNDWKCYYSMINEMMTYSHSWNAVLKLASSYVCIHTHIHTHTPVIHVN